MKRNWIFIILCAICILCLVACGTQQDPSGQTSDAQSELENTEQTTAEQTAAHVHVPDGANCKQAQYCTDCGERIAEQGAHDYPEEPDSVSDGFAYYICKTCGKINIVSQDGTPVVPIG